MKTRLRLAAYVDKDNRRNIVYQAASLDVDQAKRALEHALLEGAKVVVITVVRERRTID